MDISVSSTKAAYTQLCVRHVDADNVLRPTLQKVDTLAIFGYWSGTMIVLTGESIVTHFPSRTLANRDATGDNTTMISVWERQMERGGRKP